MKPYLFKNTTPREIGLEHGEHFRESIQEMSVIRLEMLLKEPAFKSQSQAFESAQAHLPMLEKFDRNLLVELQGIADASNQTLEKLVILNHYTDMRDIDGCTVVFCPTLKGPVFGQTWDIHGTATDHVRLFQIQDSLLLTISGCLGMCGINLKTRHAICINNLVSLDARIGLVWPALVRKALACQNAKEAKDLVLKAPLGSGHHYSVASQSDFYGIETSGTKKILLQQGAHQAHFHTNHALDPDISSVSSIRPGSTTHERYQIAQKALENHPPQNLNDLWALLREVSLPFNPKEPTKTATCGAFATDLSSGDWRACQGAPD